MKYFLSMGIMLTFAAFANPNIDTCKKDCNAVPFDQKESCLNELDDCYDQQLLNNVIFFEKNGIKKDVKFQLLKDLSEKVEILNKKIVQLQLRRAMHKKLIERAKQVVIVQE
ncbi:MAG: hypothetical protein A2381_04260 [Bdellovibrionales bacterium RIFOXYB1_FULL_37_110]|nr:MAG: hypothetical protein A2181_09485 [Bdellovibrionales bacterium RIFOXYA1_FULL_38_20]OFZ46604.1 MAG: hypothetical protein A2417_04545 [Bdellovibrionales bacterium RIFOXYC1_FULL_37_79]OFZ55475.1 MAG: hypothetical protein A2328_07820 [Bdellovibrionales bacterium RIFOXYB2_FULL_36_6]OFZ57458.1 MAG: hypothetical protein A2381_04260 [Bdellovibrionales bacterium RIFOXYB1_FULL_37_110]OFZ64543.1 MAG: hypothetical protein A2577_13735 [Bdellovibrionales bacterium RIFOXYD1_FULL_36_51]